MKVIGKFGGFTLIETLIALVILAISLLALAGLMVRTTTNNASGSYITEASTFAQRALETLRVARWTSINGGNDTVTGFNGIQYRLVWNVTQQPAPPNDVLRVVNIVVTWTDSKEHSLAFGPYNIVRPPGQ